MEENDNKVKMLGTDSTMGLFVSLYLILLAFFIVLNSLAVAVSPEASETIESVTDEFRKNISNDTEDRAGKLPAPEDDRFLTEIHGMLVSELQIDGRFSSYGGNILTMEIDEDSLFERGSMRVKPGMSPVIEQLATIVLETKGGAFEVAFLFGTGTKRATAAMIRRQVISIRRAGSLARLLQGYGLSGGSYTTGLVQGEAGKIIAVFRHKEPAINPLDVSSNSDNAELRVIHG